MKGAHVGKFDDRVSRHFGRLPVEYWEALGTRPGIKAEEALLKLFAARRKGKAIAFPTPPITGKARNIWLRQDTSDQLDAFAVAENASSITAVMIAALQLYLGQDAPKVSGPSSGAPIIRKGRKRKRDALAAQITA
jgi:hypothetical protein